MKGLRVKYLQRPNPTVAPLRGMTWLSAVLLAFTAAAFAQDPPTLDELLDIDTPEAEAEAEAPAPAPAEEEIEIEEPGAAFEQIVSDMDDVAQRLGLRQDPGIETQRTQQRIIDRLDRLISQLQQQQGGGSSSSSSSSQQQQDTGTQGSRGRQQAQPGGAQSATGPGGAAVPREAEQMGTLSENVSEWGNLPPRLRDQLLQGMEDRFSSLYRDLTEAYYRRLAEEAE